MLCPCRQGRQAAVMVYMVRTCHLFQSLKALTIGTDGVYERMLTVEEANPYMQVLTSVSMLSEDRIELLTRSTVTRLQRSRWYEISFIRIKLWICAVFKVPQRSWYQGD